MEPLTTFVADFGIGWLETTSSSIVVTSQDNDTIVFNDKGKQERVIKTGQNAIGHACRDNSLVMINLNPINNDKTVISVFSICTGEKQRELNIPTGQDCGGLLLSTIGDLLVTGCTDGSILVWDLSLSTPDPVHVLLGHVSLPAVWTIHRSILVSEAKDMMIRISDLKTGECLAIFGGYETRLGCAVFIDDKTLVTSHQNGLIKVWNIEKSSCLASFSGPPGPIGPPSLSFHGQYLLSADKSGALCFWDCKNKWSFHCALHLHSSQMMGMIWIGHDDNLVTISGSDNMKIWKFDEKFLAANKHKFKLELDPVLEIEVEGFNQIKSVGKRLVTLTITHAEGETAEVKTWDLDTIDRLCNEAVAAIESK